MAEAIFLDLIAKRGIASEWKVDSAATADYHVGKSPDYRTMKVLQLHGINNYKHVVRAVCDDDFNDFDYIFGMDEANIKDLKYLSRHLKTKSAKIELLGSYDPDNANKHIPDPYYSTDLDSFENVYELCFRACERFLDSQP